MSASANSSDSQGLLTPRNLILAAAAIFVLSVLGSCVSLLRPNDSGGLGRDSYGIRGHGYRAVMEVLEALSVPVSRDLAPPQADESDKHTLVLLGPEPRLVQFGPKYVQSLLSWVETGGRIVVAPSAGGLYRAESESKDGQTGTDWPHDILELLGLSEQLKLRFIPQAAEETSDVDREADRGWASRYDFLPDGLGGVRSSSAAPRYIQVKCTGSLSSPEEAIDELAFPPDGFTALSSQSAKLAGSVACIDEFDNEHLLVAVVPRGAGEIVVVSEPALWNNRLISEADNSVLAAYLIAPEGLPTVFDEFYHGLAVRGNPLYLLTRPGFAAVAIGLLLSVGAWTWRTAVFLGPPLPDQGIGRRDIREYIDAMGRFFCRGRGHRRFLVREVRDGVLRQLCCELRLPPDTPHVGVIAAALRRHDPRRAARLEKTISEVDAALAVPGDYPKEKTISSLQGLADCL